MYKLVFIGGFGNESVKKSKQICEQNQDILDKHYNECYYPNYPESFSIRQKALGDNYSKINENLLNQELAKEFYIDQDLGFLEPYTFDIICKCAGGGITYHLLSLLKPRNVFWCVPSIPIKDINVFLFCQSNFLFFWNQGDDRVLFFGESSVQQEKNIFENDIIPVLRENYSHQVFSYLIDTSIHDVSNDMFKILDNYFST